MDVNELRTQWERFGASDPMRAVLTNRADQDRSWTPEEFFALGHSDVARILALVERHGVNVRRGDALDFGCGAGRLTQGLADFFGSATGVDVAATMIATAQSHNSRPERLRFVQNVASDLSLFTDSRFDFVLSHIVLQHLEPELAKRYIAEFCRVLRPGGVAVFQIPTERVRRRLRYALITRLPGLTRLYRRVRHGPAPDMEMHMVPRATVEEVIARANARVVGVERDEAAGPTFISSIFMVVRNEAPAHPSTPSLPVVQATDNVR